MLPEAPDDAAGAGVGTVTGRAPRARDAAVRSARAAIRGPPRRRGRDPAAARPRS